MRYDWRDEIAELPGTEAYFREIDRRFLSSVRKYHAMDRVFLLKRSFLSSSFVTRMYSKSELGRERTRN